MIRIKYQNCNDSVDFDINLVLIVLGRPNTINKTQVVFSLKRLLSSDEVFSSPQSWKNISILVSWILRNISILRNIEEKYLYICINTGCPTILFPLLFFEFLGFLGVQKFHLGHFSIALFMQISKISNFLSFDEICIEIFQKYYREVISKVNIFYSLLNQGLEH